MLVVGSDSCGGALGAVVGRGGEGAVEVVEDFAFETVHEQLVPRHVTIADVGDINLLSSVGEEVRALAPRACLQTMRARRVVVKPNVVDPDIAQPRGYYALAARNALRVVAAGLPDQHRVSDLDRLGSELSDVELSPCALVLGACDVGEDQIASLLGQETALPVFVEDVIGENAHHWRVELPRVVLVLNVDVTARVRPWGQLEDPQTKPDIRMRHVIMRLSQGVAHRAHISSSRRSIGMRLDLIPKAIEVTTCRMVEPEVIGRVGDPEGSHRDVGLQHEEGHDRADC